MIYIIYRFYRSDQLSQSPAQLAIKNNEENFFETYKLVDGVR